MFACDSLYRNKLKVLRVMVLQMAIVQGALLTILNVFNDMDEVKSKFDLCFYFPEPICDILGFNEKLSPSGIFFFISF